MSRPLFTLPDAQRTNHVRQFVGRFVSIDVDYSRNGEVQVLEGMLLAVARPLTGAQTNAAILRTNNFDDFAISLATIRNIFPMKKEQTS